MHGAVYRESRCGVPDLRAAVCPRSWGFALALPDLCRWGVGLGGGGGMVVICFALPVTFG